MIASEALHKGITKVKQATPNSAMNDKDEVMIQTTEDGGIVIRRENSESYAEFFLHCSVTEQGTVVVKSDSLRFLENAVGDRVFYLKGNLLKTNDDDSIKIISSGKWDYFSRKNPSIEFYPMPPVVRKILWSNDPKDIVIGHLYFSGRYLATTDRLNYSVAGLENPIAASAIFPVSAIAAFKGDDDYFIGFEEKKVWFKKGNFVVGTSLVSYGNKMPSHFDIIFQAEIETMPYFSIDKDEFSRVIEQVITHASSSVHEGFCKCYLNLREDGSLYLESNWSELGQIRRTLKTKSHLESFEVSITGQYLKSAIAQLEGDEVNFILAGMMGKTYPMIAEDRNRFLLSQTDLAWQRIQNEP